MKITIFGATGKLGRECLKQAIDAGHDVTALVRSSSKLPAKLRDKITVIEGDGLNADDVAQSIQHDTEAILFAVGVVKQSPENLCTDVTQNILNVMANTNTRRLVFCSGGSTLVDDDQITFGARFVEKFSSTFMPLKHFDKEHQYQLLEGSTVEWIGIRPLQMRNGPKRAQYRLGFDSFNGMSYVSFADCAHAMVNMLNDDTWLRKAPIIQY